MESPAIERSIEIDATPEEVWDYVTDGELLSTWFEGPVSLDPAPSGDILFEPEGAEPIWGTVEEVIPNRRIQWSWRSDEGNPSLVEIELEPTKEGTNLVVRERLLPWHISGPNGTTTMPLAQASTVRLAA